MRYTLQRYKTPYRLTSGPWGIFGLVLLGIVIVLVIWSVRQYHR